MQPEKDTRANSGNLIQQTAPNLTKMTTMTMMYMIWMQTCQKTFISWAMLSQANASSMVSFRMFFCVCFILMVSGWITSASLHSNWSQKTKTQHIRAENGLLNRLCGFPIVVMLFRCGNFHRRERRTWKKNHNSILYTSLNLLYSCSPLVGLMKSFGLPTNNKPVLCTIENDRVFVGMKRENKMKIANGRS